MIRLIMYPFLKQTVSLIYTLQNEAPALFKTIELCGIVPEAIAYHDKDISIYRNRNSDLHIELYSLDSMPMLCNDVVFLQLPHEDTSTNRVFVNTVSSWIRERGMKIYTSPTEALRACGYFTTKNRINSDCFRVSRPVLRAINVPVIGICSVFPFSDTTEVTARLKGYLSKEMTVSTVYTNSLHKGWGYHFIDLDYLGTLPFEDRIFYVNWYLNQVLSNEPGDILVVEIPHSIMGLNMRTLFGGGEYPFVFSQAVGFDYVICCVPANDITTFSFPHLKKHLETRFGMHNISFHVSNQHYFLEKESLNGNIPYMFVSGDYIAKKIEEARKANCELPLYDLLNEQDIIKWREMK